MRDQTICYSVVRFEIPGIHCWPNAKVDDYLRHDHRHLFKFEVRVEGDEFRGTEYMSTKRMLEEHYGKTGSSIAYFGAKSCEQIARELREYVIAIYPHKRVEVEVFEDGENGAIIVERD